MQFRKVGESFAPSRVGGREGLCCHGQVGSAVGQAALEHAPDGHQGPDRLRGVIRHRMRMRGRNDQADLRPGEARSGSFLDDRCPYSNEMQKKCFIYDAKSSLYKTKRYECILPNEREPHRLIETILIHSSTLELK